ncbi:MAG: hypothetical protein ACRDT0_12155 [Pseudonocardiaceae bacterium]
MTAPGGWPKHSADDTPTGPLYDLAAASWWLALAAESPTVPLRRLPRRRPQPLPVLPPGQRPDAPDLDLLRRVRDGLRNLPTEPR